MHSNQNIVTPPKISLFTIVIIASLVGVKTDSGYFEYNIFIFDVQQ